MTLWFAFCSSRFLIRKEGNANVQILSKSLRSVVDIKQIEKIENGAR